MTLALLNQHDRNTSRQLNHSLDTKIRDEINLSANLSPEILQLQKEFLTLEYRIFGQLKYYFAV